MASTSFSLKTFDKKVLELPASNDEEIAMRDTLSKINLVGIKKLAKALGVQLISQGDSLEKLSLVEGVFDKWRRHKQYLFSDWMEKAYKKEYIWDKSTEEKEPPFRERLENLSLDRLQGVARELKMPKYNGKKLMTKEELIEVLEEKLKGLVKFLPNWWIGDLLKPSEEIASTSESTSTSTSESTNIQESPLFAKLDQFKLTELRTIASCLEVPKYKGDTHVSKLSLMEAIIKRCDHVCIKENIQPDWIERIQKGEIDSIWKTESGVYDSAIKLLTNQTNLEVIGQALSSFNYKFNPNLREKLLEKRIDPQGILPCHLNRLVELISPECQIVLHEFAADGGFFYNSYKDCKRYPRVNGGRKVFHFGCINDKFIFFADEKEVNLLNANQLVKTN